MEIIAVEVFDGHIRIDYADGSREDIDGGIYEHKDANGDTVEQRAATQADIDRLAALAAEFEAANPPSTAEVVDVQIVGDNIEVEYADGTREVIENGIYERKDADNETIIERLATADDIERLSDLAIGEIPTPGDDDGTPDQGPGDAPGTPGGDDGTTPGEDDGTPDQGPGDGGTGDGGTGGGTGDGGTGDGGGGGTTPEPTIVGTEGDDKIRGTRGDDVIDAMGGDDEVRGRRGDDIVNGGDGNDLVRGDEGNDIVNGGNGDDKVKGDLGNDVLNGDAGSDIYNGGGGADTFVFDADGALDKIADYEDGVDVIDISSYGLADVDGLLAGATQGIDFVLLDFGGGDVLQIDDVTVDQLSAEDFIL